MKLQSSVSKPKSSCVRLRASDLFHSRLPDRGVPASRHAVVTLVNDLEKSLADGEKIAVHCRQGVGRSPLIAACLLVSGGEEPRSAFERMSSTRGITVP